LKNYLARIKKLDPKHGAVLKQFVYKGITFKEGAGWYEVSTEVAEYLKKVCQQSHDPKSPLAFEVCSAKEAKTKDETEELKAKTKRPAEKAKKVVARGEFTKSRKTTKSDKTEKSDKTSETPKEDKD